MSTHPVRESLARIPSGCQSSANPIALTSTSNRRTAPSGSVAVSRARSSAAAPEDHGLVPTRRQPCAVERAQQQLGAGRPHAAQRAAVGRRRELGQDRQRIEVALGEPSQRAVGGGDGRPARAGARWCARSRGAARRRGHRRACAATRPRGAGSSSVNVAAMSSTGPRYPEWALSSTLSLGEVTHRTRCTSMRASPGGDRGGVRRTTTIPTTSPSSDAAAPGAPSRGGHGDRRGRAGTRRGRDDRGVHPFDRSSGRGCAGACRHRSSSPPTAVATTPQRRARATVTTDVDVVVLEGRWRGPSAARAAAVRHALAGRDPATTWLAHTDADCLVGDGWLAGHLVHARGGFDAIAGTVLLDASAPADLVTRVRGRLHARRRCPPSRPRSQLRRARRRLRGGRRVAGPHRRG